MKLFNGLRLLVSIILLSALLTACGGSDANEDPDADAQVPINTKPAELVFYSSSGDTPESFNQRFGDPIRKKFPHYTITYIQMKQGTFFPELLASGQTVDIFWDSVGTFSGNIVNYEMNYDMSGMIKKYKVDLGRFEPVPLDAVRSFSNGGIYGLPVFNNNMVLYYNKDLFDKFGFPYPKDGMTWDEVNELAKKFDRVEDKVSYSGLSISPKHLLRMNNLSEHFADPTTHKHTLDTDKWKKLLETYYVTPGTNPIMKQKTTKLSRAPFVDEFFKEKSIAMFPYLSNAPTNVPEFFRSMNWDMVSFPVFKELPGVGSQAYPTYFGITAQSKEKDAAMEVIKYLTSDEYQLEYSKKGVMTVLKDQAILDAYGTETEFRDHNLRAVYSTKFAPISKKTIYDEAILSVLSSQVKNLVNGTMDVNTFIRTTGEEAQKQIDAMKK